MDLALEVDDVRRRVFGDGQAVPRGVEAWAQQVEGLDPPGLEAAAHERVVRADPLQAGL